MATPRTTPVVDEPDLQNIQRPAPRLPIDYVDRPVWTAAASHSTSGARSARRRLERKQVTVDWGVGAQRVETGPAGRIQALLLDLIWVIRHDVRIPLAFAAAIGLLFIGYIGVFALSGRIYPNVWTLGIGVGGMTIEEAEAALSSAWAALRIRLVDEERSWELTPGELGLRLDARATAQAARGVGLSGIPFGINILPTIAVDELRAQTRLLDMTDRVKIDPYNAGYRWVNDQLVGVPGRPGRYLDVAGTMSVLLNNPSAIVNERRLDLRMTPVNPDVLDPAPYLEEARRLTTQPFSLYGYDPFTDERVLWRTDRDTFTSWLEAGANGLTLREEVFAPFLDLQTQSLEATNPLRYLEPTDAIDKVRAAIENGRSEVSLRIRYRTSTYTVQRGDTGYGIARRLGVPFFLIQQANPGRDWDALLVPGDVINLPSPDAVIQLDPVPSQRIVVDLETQHMWAFENGRLVYEWAISSGMAHAPTSPGVYQILSHAERATGSSIELCGDNSCGTWEMYWFMGIYEVIPGLVNGFHGAVLLPGGRYLGGGNVGQPYTYGCIMSENHNAELLYRWAQRGTIVEIVSREYAPRSLLARSVVTAARQNRVNMIVQSALRSGLS